ncbi:cyclase family protein [Halorussus sp. MSC15.2]|uniref:cyclase family protein n=1 Tax=Halorussus sp. MSC15.2 TaxID=2283638 RepID=UPI0013D2C426|nr:cyclase family protein [Halorussus sp. MSC15.2]NEU57994.1 cyclase family protein [Halorussus sp. MSC15.2]
MPTRDLTQPLDDGVTVYPGDPPVERTPAATHASDGYRVTEVRLGTHSGTHVDAPSHTEPDGKNLDEFAVERFAFDARLVDCSSSGARDPVCPESVPDDADAEMLVFRTGWDDHWGTERYYDHPYLARETAAKCAERGYHVGTDALSPDPSPSARDAERDGEPDGVPAHRELLGSDLLVVENLTGTDDLPERFELRAYPLALAGADGSPVRAVAVW